MELSVDHLHCVCKDLVFNSQSRNGGKIGKERLICFRGNKVVSLWLLLSPGMIQLPNCLLSWTKLACSWKVMTVIETNNYLVLRPCRK